MLNHITFQVKYGTLFGLEDDAPRHPISEFMESLGLHEVNASDELEKGWRVRWWRGPFDNTTIHLVESEEGQPVVALGLGHFCLFVDRMIFPDLCASRYLERSSGSGRIWLAGPSGLRVEVRPR